jgi:hypothetical protein
MQDLKITDLTLDNLKRLIQQVVDERIQQHSSGVKDLLSVQNILAAIEQHRWTPSPGVPKASQLIIEERKQWQHESP